MSARSSRMRNKRRTIWQFEYSLVVGNVPVCGVKRMSARSKDEVGVLRVLRIKMPAGSMTPVPEPSFHDDFSDKSQYIIPRGRVYFDPFEASQQPTGEIYLGVSPDMKVVQDF